MRSGLIVPVCWQRDWGGVSDHVLPEGLGRSESYCELLEGLGWTDHSCMLPEGVGWSESSQMYTQDSDQTTEHSV